MSEAGGEMMPPEDLAPERPALGQPPIEDGTSQVPPIGDGTTEDPPTQAR